MMESGLRLVVRACWRIACLRRGSSSSGSTYLGLVISCLLVTAVDCHDDQTYRTYYHHCAVQDDASCHCSPLSLLLLPPPVIPGDDENCVIIQWLMNIDNERIIWLSASFSHILRFQFHHWKLWIFYHPMNVQFLHNRFSCITQWWNLTYLESLLNAEIFNV